MTKVLLLSDTHAYMDDRIINYAQQADVIFHAGDIGTTQITDQLKAHADLFAVYGNIDGHEVRAEYPEEVIVSIEKVKIFMHHIGKYPPHYTPAIRKRLDEVKPRLYFCGHSHILKVIPDQKRNLIHMNPGACGIHGFHQLRTLLRFNIDGTHITDLEVIELGLRGSLKKLR